MKAGSGGSIDGGLSSEHGPREWRRALDHVARKAFNQCGGTVQHDFDFAAQVAHQAVEAEFVREPVHERTETDALDNSSYNDMALFWHFVQVTFNFLSSVIIIGF